MLADDPAPTRPETFAEACRRLASGARLARLERHAFAICGEYPLAALTRSDVRAVLAGMARAEMARSSCGQVLADMRAVCREAEVTPNPCERITLPREAYVDRRERVRLTDAEFAAFVGRCDDAELVALAVLSRCIGGLRTSDLLALRWESFEAGAVRVLRPKTGAVALYAVPEAVVPYLASWHRVCGSPREGSLFARSGAVSFARRLRRALWPAGVRRGVTKATCALQSNTAVSRRVDFHSFRRAFVDATARAGLNVQASAALAGHASLSAHQRYLTRAELLVVPAAVLPPIAPAA